MNQHDYFKDIYTDFFGIENDKVSNDEEIPRKLGSQEEMTSCFALINDLAITEESRDLLKQIIEYMRKYHEGIETNYVPFHVVISANNDKVIREVNDILYREAKYFEYIDNNNSKEYSLYELDKELKFSEYGYIYFTHLSGLNIIDDTKQKKFLYDMEEVLKNDDKVLITLSGSVIDINQFFLGREYLKNKYFDFYIEGINPDVQDVYQYVLEHTNLSENLNVSLLDYVSNTYNKDEDFVKYQNDLVKYISFHKELPKIEKNKSMEEIFSELNELVGLDKVKKVLYELVDVMSLKEKAGKDLKIKDMNLHMVFLGNPGTGKTTIARIIAGILYNLGYVKENKLIEVGVKDLVAEYVGQTAPKTMSVIEKSMNGVLFIDEAYSLAVKGDNSYNAEAIATLIQAMENYRDKLVVIFAGYTKEMQDFLNSNSGIVSRIGYTLEFDDYTTDELVEIFLGFMKKSGFEVTDEAIDYLKSIIDDNRNMKNFGNARFVRNIYEKSIVKHASRVKDKKQKKILRTIVKEDISIDNLILE